MKYNDLTMLTNNNDRTNQLGHYVEDILVVVVANR